MVLYESTLVDLDSACAGLSEFSRAERKSNNVLGYPILRMTSPPTAQFHFSASEVGTSRLELLLLVRFPSRIAFSIIATLTTERFLTALTCLW